MPSFLGNIAVYDQVMIVFYFVFIFGMGFWFAGFNKNPSDYFRGGASMVWWMVGVTAFMTQFSAWTFIGAASKAYEDGFIVAVIFFGNALGYLLNALWSGPIFRQMRLITSIESVRERFDRVNEQVFLWLQVPISLIYSGIWLNALAVFIAAVFGVEVWVTILVTGFVVVAMSASGGSWAVVASDFIQATLLMTVAVLMAVLTLMSPEVGGISGFLEKMPAHHWNWSSQGPPAIIWLWVVAYIIRQIITTNSLMESYRYFYVKDGEHARWAGFLAFGLMTVGPFLWFVPPMAAAFLQPDMASVYPNLPNANEGAYVYMGQRLLPPGMLGLLLCGMFAATMSSMDAGLNRNSGILIKNLYQPFLAPHATDKHLLTMGIFASCLCGGVSITVALFLNQLESLNLFDTMMIFAGLVGLPLAMPLLLSLIVWRTPPWSGWSTAAIGFSISLALYLYVEWWKSNPALQGLSVGERKDLLFVLSLFVNAGILVPWFLFTTLFYDSSAPKYRQRVEAFKARTYTPVDFEKEVGEETDNMQARTLGWMALCYGAFIAGLAVLPNSMTGHVCFLVTGGVIGTIGTGLIIASHRGKKPKTAKAPIAS